MPKISYGLANFEYGDSARMTISITPTPAPQQSPIKAQKPFDYWVLETDYESYAVVYSCSDVCRGRQHTRKDHIISLRTHIHQFHVFGPFFFQRPFGSLAERPSSRPKSSIACMTRSKSLDLTPSAWAGWTNQNASTWQSPFAPRIPPSRPPPIPLIGTPHGSFSPPWRIFLGDRSSIMSRRWSRIHSLVQLDQINLFTTGCFKRDLVLYSFTRLSSDSLTHTMEEWREMAGHDAHSHLFLFAKLLLIASVLCIERIE